MTTTVQAIYEKGIFRPLQQLDLSEGTRVDVVIPHTPAARDPKTVAENLARIAATAPLRTSGDRASMEHDSYLYRGNGQS